MSFGSRGSGSPAAADAPDGVMNHRLVDMPAADLVAHLIRCNSRASDFVDVALVLAARERRLVEAEAQVRAADDAAVRMADEITAQGRCAAEAAAQIHLAAEREAHLRAEIRAWQRRAAEAEARLQAYVDGPPDRTEDDREHVGPGAEIAARDDVPGGPSWLMLITGAAIPAEPAPVLQAAELHLPGHGTTEEGRGEEVPLPVVSCKRKEPVVSSEDKGADEDDGRTSPRQGLKKLKQRGSRFPNARDEAGAQDQEEGCDLQESSLGIVGGGDVPEERTRTEPAEQGDADMSVEVGDGDYESGGDQVSSEIDPLPLGHDDLLQISLKITGGLETGTEQGVGDQKVAEDDAAGKMILQQELEVGGARHAGNEQQPPNVDADAVVEPGRSIMQAAGVQEPEPEPDQVPSRRAAVACAQGSGGGDDDEPETGVPDTQVSPAAGAAIHSGASSGSGSTARRNNGKYYKMVFRALKEKEKKLALAAALGLANKPAAATAVASQPNLICVLYAPLPKELVAAEDGPDDKDEPQQ